MGIFEEESAEDAAFWEDPVGAVAAEVASPESPEEPAEEAPDPGEEGPGDDPADGDEPDEGGEPDPAPDPAAEAQAALEARLAAAEKRLADKDEFINRQANEIGDLRSRTQQIEQQATMTDWDEVLYENPARAAQMALNAGDQRRYMQAREAWDELSPGAPQNFEQNITLKRELEQLKEQLQQTTEPIHQRAELEQVAIAYQHVREKYPEYDNFEGQMGEILNTRPLMKESLSSALRSGTVEEQAAALEDLYLLAAGRKRDTLQDAAREAKATLDATSQAQRQAAAVVTGGASNDSVAQSIADKIGAEWDELASPYEDGWNV